MLKTIEIAIYNENTVRAGERALSIENEFSAMEYEGRDANFYSGTREELLAEADFLENIGLVYRDLFKLRIANTLRESVEGVS